MPQQSADSLLDALGSAHGLAPMYFVYGDEPLQTTEIVDALRAAAERLGVSERRVISIESSSDWDELRAEQGAMSLFASQRLIEVRLGAKKPDKRGTEVLEGLVDGSQSDDVYLVTAAKPDARARKARWFKLLEQHALSVNVRDLPPRQLPSWLSRRAGRYGKRLSTEAGQLISDRVEGNLLAAAQEVEKLCLTVGHADIDLTDVINAVTDSARFDVFQLADAMLGFDLIRAVRVVRGLREEGTEAVLVAWALARELRSLCVMAEAVNGGENVGRVLDRHRVWSNRKSLTGRVLQTFTVAEMARFRVEINRIDMGIKGARTASPWDEIECLLMRFCSGRQAAVS